jgi:hypothetical protein
MKNLTNCLKDSKIGMKNKKTNKLPASTLVISITQIPTKLLKKLQARKKRNGKKEKL